MTASQWLAHAEASLARNGVTGSDASASDRSVLEHLYHPTAMAVETAEALGLGFHADDGGLTLAAFMDDHQRDTEA